MIKKPDSYQMDFFYDVCAKNNLRVTPQRVAIYEELAKAEDHPSADVLYNKVRKTLPNISFDTVYRTALSFSKIGLVNLVEGYGEEKRFDPKIKNHHHFRCMKCYKIVDFYGEFSDKIKIPPELEKQFNILNKKVVLEGFCGKCKKR